MLSQPIVALLALGFALTPCSRAEASPAERPADVKTVLVETTNPPVEQHVTPGSTGQPEDYAVAPTTFRLVPVPQDDPECATPFAPRDLHLPVGGE